MYVKIQTSDLSNGNTGSCSQLVFYLEKENLGKNLSEHRLFFSQNQEEVLYNQVIESIDKNGKGGLGKKDAKFYSLVIAPTQEELEHIGNSEEKLREYTREAMQAYAENFNKGLNSQDLVWYAKIEDSRTYKNEIDIPLNKHKGDEKEGLQTHIHVIVSRKTADKKSKISPLANEKGVEGKIGDMTVMKGFDRNNYKFACEKIFDEKFSYPRKTEESYEYFKTMSKNDSSAKQVLLEKVKKEQEQREQEMLKEQQIKQEQNQQERLHKEQQKLLEENNQKEKTDKEKKRKYEEEKIIRDRNQNQNKNNQKL